MAEGRKPTGRPTDYNEDIAARLCELIAEAGSLAGALALDDSGEMPALRTVYRWLAKHEGFRHAYMRARELADEPMADEMIRIANDPEIASDQKRVMVDVLKWQLARRSSKKWGDKLAMEHTGAQGGPIQTIDASRLSTTVLQELLSVRRAEADAG